VFCLLPYRDAIVVFRGLLILVIIITIGVTVSERQLNSLTHRQEAIRIFNIQSEKGVYSIDILGSNHSVAAVYSVGELINKEKALIIKTANYSITIPTYIEIDCKKVLVSLDAGAKLLRDKGFELKQTLESYLTGLPQKLNVYFRQFR